MLLLASAAMGQRGQLRGSISDKNERSSLPGVSVFIEGTTIGTSTDVDGNYNLNNIPAGEVNIVFAFLGYKRVVKSFVFEEGSMNQRYNLAMEMDAVQIQEAVVIGQAQGQLSAINQQLRSNTIVNVVSAERIQELPDQNAAEAVGRLPGVSVLRENGEGQRVVVRGLSPKFNSITVNGIRLPSTDGNDRSVDLSMIAPEALDGIEVFKALRPDMEADAIGGTVNFVMRKTASEPTIGGKLQLGYNQQENEYGQWKFDVFGGKRFMDDKFGISVSANGQRANRSSDLLNADYILQGELDDGTANTIITNLNLGDRLEVRRRYSGSLNFDYQFNDLHSLVASNSFGYIERDEVRRRRRYRLNDNYQEYDIRDRQRATYVVSNMLNGYHQILKGLTFTWQGARSQSVQRNIFEHQARWRELGAFNENLVDDRGPERVPLGAINNVDRLFLRDARADVDEVDELSYTARADLKYDYAIGKDLSGYLKTGGLVRDQQRIRDLSRSWTGGNVLNVIGPDDADRFQRTANGDIAIFDFVDNSFVAPDFLNSDVFFMGLGSNDNNNVGLDRDAVNQFYEDFGDRYTRDDRVDLESYTARERIESGYIMNETNWRRLMVMGGVRYENTILDYRATVGQLLKLDNEEWVVNNPREEVNNRSYHEWLPMLHLRYKFTDWLDLRLAATKTLARPNFSSLVPFQIIDDQNRIARSGNPDLQHTTVWNYDAFVSIYTDKFGLFTLGGFYKELENVEYQSQTRLVAPGDALNGYQIITPRNAIGLSYVRGFEIDYQNSFRWMPKPFDGIVLNANFTMINSTTYYPFFSVETQMTPPFETVVIDTERRGQMPGQSDILANVSIGYEKKGFSGRISVVHQGDALFAVGTRAEGDIFTVATTRWDIALSQRFKKNWMVFVNLNNITNQREAAFLGSPVFSSNIEYFGFTADVGVRYVFKRR